MNETIVVSEFPVRLETGDRFTFKHEGASYEAIANCLHVFHEAVSLADHLSKSARGLYDGLTVL